MPATPLEPIRRRLIFSGTVQGVGFRYTARSLATRFRVAGFVRNLPDGTVEAVAEGAPAEVDQFQHAVSDAMRRYISSLHVEDTAPTGEYHSFDIVL